MVLRYLPLRQARVTACVRPYHQSRILHISKAWPATCLVHRLGHFFSSPAIKHPCTRHGACSVPSACRFPRRTLWSRPPTKTSSSTPSAAVSPHHQMLMSIPIRLGRDLPLPPLDCLHGPCAGLQRPHKPAPPRLPSMARQPIPAAITTVPTHAAITLVSWQGRTTLQIQSHPSHISSALERRLLLTPSHLRRTVASVRSPENPREAPAVTLAPKPDPSHFPKGVADTTTSSTKSVIPSRPSAIQWPSHFHGGLEQNHPPLQYRRRTIHNLSRVRVSTSQSAHRSIPTGEAAKISS